MKFHDIKNSDLITFIVWCNIKPRYNNFSYILRYRNYYNYNS